MEFWTLLLRTLMIYFVVLLIMRMMGKREIGKMSVFDLVISFMIAEIAVLVIEDTKRPMIDGLIPMGALMVIQILISYIALKSRPMRLLIDGKPSVIIADGKLNQKEMRKMRYNLDDLLLQLRENQVARVADVEFAVLETSGKLSVIPKESPASSKQNKSNTTVGYKAKQLPQLSSPSNYRFEPLPIPLIMDGKVMDENLEKLQKNRLWLKQQLRSRGLTEWKQVFFCSIDHKGELFVDINTKQR